MTRLLGISGSLRAASTNSLLVKEAARIFDADHFDFADLNVPLYSGDIESDIGIPASVQRLADQIAAADAVIIATPEYNKSISGVLKNALDWVSRVDGNPWADKPVAVMSATAGRSGGERAQDVLRHAMRPFRPNLIPGNEVLVGETSKQFDETGTLTNERYIKAVTGLMTALKSQL
ncbi:NADPH-dependent FMN reductase [Aestuariibius sp. HNIBRBA575]|uniref:NADPH-dependent FMN reductase n=1 Tax=Aestuariibius sp. HNIBRBA575 TaxID=3233343 RepID=UPI0034A466B3